MRAGGSGGILCNISFVALSGKSNLVTTFSSATAFCICYAQDTIVFVRGQLLSNMGILLILR